MGIGERKEASASALAEDLKRNEAVVSLVGLLAMNATVEEAKTATVEEAKTSGVEKRKKLVKKQLTQELIDQILKQTFSPFSPAEEIPGEILDCMSERSRASYARCKARYLAMAAFDADIINQYNTKGYAEIEEEVSDDEVHKVEN